MGNKQIGKRIQLSREKKGYTQEQFAEMINISTNYISAVECGIKFPRLDNLIAIINGLDVSADEIFMDVTNTGYKVKASKFSEDLDTLSSEDRSRIFAVVETMIKDGSE